VSDAWLVVIVVGAITIAFKAAGPVLLGSRQLGERTLRVVELLAPVMLVALVVTQTFGGDQAIVVDERVAGVAAGGIALWRGVPLVPAMVIAAVVTAGLRALV
jgi:branched-subunit amino acid transport protein